VGVGVGASDAAVRVVGARVSVEVGSGSAIWVEIGAGSEAIVFGVGEDVEVGIGVVIGGESVCL
jgi:hypothetical protein